MKNELIVKQCENCKATVRVIKDCGCENCGIKCCNKEMTNLKPNSTEAKSDKHIPTYERVEDEIFVSINHPMEKEHYIEWISLVKDNQESFIKLYPEQNAQCRFKYIPESKIYAYCNKHGLWKTDVK